MQQAELLAAVEGKAIPIVDSDTFGARPREAHCGCFRIAERAHLRDVYREAITALRELDAVGLRGMLKSISSEILESFETWRSDPSTLELQWGQMRSPTLADMQPRIDRFVSTFGDDIDRALALGLALVEFKREDLPTLLAHLDRLGELSEQPRSGTVAVNRAGYDIAASIGLQRSGRRVGPSCVSEFGCHHFLARPEPRPEVGRV